MALLGNGAQINTIMPEFIKTCSLDVKPLSDFIGRNIVCTGLGNTLTRPIGYVMIQVQVDDAKGYNEEKIALIVLDLSNFVV